jgi:uncharacterized protein YndB with AHSA1/START domain
MTESPGAPTIEGTLHSGGGKGAVRMKCRYTTGIDDLWSALTDPKRLAHWYGKVQGELRVGGEFTAYVTASGWDGRGRIEECVPPRQLRLTVSEEDGPEEVVTAALAADGDGTTLALEVRGMPLDLVWAYGAGWQVHLEDLGAHIAGQDRASSDTRWNELEVIYREMAVVPLAS